MPRGFNKRVSIPKRGSLKKKDIVETSNPLFQTNKINLPKKLAITIICWTESLNSVERSFKRIAKTPKVYTNLPPHLRNTFSYNLKVLEHNGAVLHYMDDEIKDHQELIMVAAKHPKFRLIHASERMQKTRDVVIQTIHTIEQQVTELEWDNRTKQSLAKTLGNFENDEEIQLRCCKILSKMSSPKPRVWNSFVPDFSFYRILIKTMRRFSQHAEIQQCCIIIIETFLVVSRDPENPMDPNEQELHLLFFDLVLKSLASFPNNPEIHERGIGLFARHQDGYYYQSARSKLKDGKVLSHAIQRFPNDRTILMLCCEILQCSGYVMRNNPHVSKSMDSLVMTMIKDNVDDSELVCKALGYFQSMDTSIKDGVKVYQKIIDLTFQLSESFRNNKFVLEQCCGVWLCLVEKQEFCDYLVQHNIDDRVKRLIRNFPSHDELQYKCSSILDGLHSSAKTL